MESIHKCVDGLNRFMPLGEQCDKCGFFYNAEEEIELLRKERDECLQTIARLDEANLCMHTELATLRQERDELVAALESISKNTCCGDCQEAKRVAQAALAILGADKEAT